MKQQLKETSISKDSLLAELSHIDDTFTYVRFIDTNNQIIIGSTDPIENKNISSAICEAVNNYNALKDENEQLKQALQMFHDAFIHKDGETKKNKVKTDMIGLCDEMKDALNNSRQLLDYGVKQL